MMELLQSVIAKIVALAMIVSTAASTFLKSERVIFFESYPTVVVDTIWNNYRDKIQKDGRTIDRDRNFITTSEGQSYSLLRAVWMDDKETFDQVLKWTNTNLRKRKEDKLFAWLWGKRADGTWDVIEAEGGMNTASDADQDIALALIFAHKRWNQEHYLKQAKQVLKDIWEQEVVVVKGKPYLVAGNWAGKEESPTLNPSYFAVAAYPIFAKIDTEHPWLRLKDSSYEALEALSINALDKETSVGLPPDWAGIDRASGKIGLVIHKDKTSDFSDDAFRVLWRVALDWEWYRDERAKRYLESLSFLEKEWKEKRMVYGSYAKDGRPTKLNESSSMYGAVISYLSIVNPVLAREVFREKIVPLYNQDLEGLNESLGYYAQNWVWFGTAFYTGRLTNLYFAE